MTRSQIMNLYLDYLRDEGFRPELDADGDVRFKIEARTYYLLVDEKDTECVRVIYPNFWPLETPIERRRAIEAAERATAETKVAKVFLVGDNTWTAYEMLCVSPEALKPVFARAIRTIRAATRRFVERMTETAGEGRNVGLA